MILCFTDIYTYVNQYTYNLYTCSTYIKQTHNKSYEI